ncbi:LOG family protein [Nocardioides sp. TF02-7]|uniref:LOG family protein n=1 Tax=Nocardioides sp. TF02-7 TaxID=2917724 RepID=UPI001F06BF91|nr:LOG family protein [Nocardioides sp. TF02-7]UMG91866.1 LOG family protein [Nocardioides sp. TF02-7]
MHARKAMMADLADAFLCLPGGLGTLEEVFEVWSWRQLANLDDPVGFLNTAGFWDPPPHRAARSRRRRVRAPRRARRPRRRRLARRRARRAVGPGRHAPSGQAPGWDLGRIRDRAGAPSLD